MDNATQAPATATKDEGTGRNGKLKAKPIGVYFRSTEQRARIFAFAESMEPERSVSGLLLEATEFFMKKHPQKPKTEPQT